MKIRSLIAFLLIVLILNACTSDNDTTIPDRNLIDVIKNPIIVHEPWQGTLSQYSTFQDFLDFKASFEMHHVNTNNIISGGSVWMPMMWHTSQGVTQSWDLNAASGHINPYIHMTPGERMMSEIILPSLLAVDENNRFILGDDHHGPVIMEIDIQQQTVTLTMREDVHIRWHDGVPLTLDGLFFAYYYYFHPDRSPRWMITNEGQSFFINNIVGALEFFRREQADISGIHLSDDEMVMTIEFLELTPAILYGGLFGHPLPRHHFEGIAIEAIAGHINSRERMLGFGPFMLDQTPQTVRNTYYLNANPYYWQGPPHLDQLELANVWMHTGIINSALINKSGAFISEQDAQSLPRFVNVSTENEQIFFYNNARIYNITNFAADGGEVVGSFLRYDDSPVNDYVFRQALALAVNNAFISNELTPGISVVASSNLHPYHAQRFIDSDSVGLSGFDLDKANDLLNRAGYHWGDEYRLDLNGNPFFINIAMLQHPQWQARYHLLRDDFREIGVELRLLTPNIGMWWNYYDLLWFLHQNQFREDGVPHLVLMNQPVNENPDPNFRFGGSSNIMGFASDALDDYLTRFQTAWDDGVQAQLYRSFDAFLTTQVPSIPLTWTLNFQNVHPQIANWNNHRGLYHDNAFAWHLIGLTE